MKETNIVLKLFKRYDFQREISLPVRSRILKSKKNIYRSILRKNHLSFSAVLAARAYLFFREMGISMSVQGGARFVYASAAACFIAIAGVSLLLVDTFKPYQPSAVVAEASSSRVVQIVGDVSLARNGETILLKRADEIRKGDRVVTGDNSFAVIQFRDTGIIKVHGGTQFSIDSIDCNSRTLVRLEKGKIYSRLKKLLKNSSYAVCTNMYTAEVRGTEFLATSDVVSGEVQVLEGKVNVTARNLDRDIEAMTGITISNSAEGKEYPLARLQKLLLQKDSLYAYIENLDTLSDEDLEAVLSDIKKSEAVIDREIQKLQGPGEKKEEYVKPLDRLRQQGKPLTMLYLRDGTQLGGSVVNSSANQLKLDTGEGVIAVPVKEIVRRVPMK